MARRTPFFIVVLLLGTSILFFYHLRQHETHHNLIFITVDALRPDHLSCYGYKDNSTPNIDGLAKKGTLFKNAISQASWTRPSVRSLMTSTYASTHGVFLLDQELSGAPPSLPQILQDEGYSTGFISAHGGIARRESPLGKAFDAWEDIGDFTAEDVTQRAVKWLKRNRDKNFFLWIHYMDAHDSSLGFPHDKITSENITRKETDFYTAKYDEAISYIDKEIGDLLKALKRSGLDRTTVIVFSADHGQALNEHGFCFSHGGALYECLIRVPLIIYCPALFPRAKDITQQVQHIDIVPTVCDMLKIRKSRSFEGKSLLALVEARGGHPRYAFSEHVERQGDLSTGDWVYTNVSIRSADYKLICTYRPGSETYEFYNIKKDPGESNNIAESETGKFKLFKRELDRWMHRPKPDITPSKMELDEEAKNRFRSLGYMQ